MKGDVISLLPLWKLHPQAAAFSPRRLLLGRIHFSCFFYLYERLVRARNRGCPSRVVVVFVSNSPLL